MSLATRCLYIILLAFMVGPALAANTPPTEEAPSTMNAIPSYLVVRTLGEELATLERAGKLTEAEAWIARSLERESGDSQALINERDRLARLRRDYGLDSEAMLALIRESIPDATMADLDKWRAAREIQSIVIDGEPRYFRREPRNLFRFSSEARNRRDAALQSTPSAPEGDPNTRETARFDLHEHVLAALAEYDATGNEYPAEVRIRARHTITVKPGVVPQGETIRCWIPYPQQMERQGGVELVGASGEHPLIAPNGSIHRTIFMSTPAPAADQPTVFWVEYAYTTSAYISHVDPDKALDEPFEEEFRARYLADAPPHAALTPEVRALAREIVGEETNPWRKAEKIFHWMDANIRYCAEMEYSTITSITDKVMTERQGDCGVFVLLFVTLCRAEGVPARWESGWAMRPGNENLHDWAEFYVAPWGWLPADPSFGLRNHDNPRVRGFYLGNIDACRMVANKGFASDFNPSKEHWRSDNIDNQRGEVEWSGGNLYYDDWAYKMEVEYDFTK